MDNLTQTEVRSTNGRRGIAIVHPDGIDPYRPTEGRLSSMGEIAGLKTYRLHPESGTGRWYVLEEDTEPVVGVEVIEGVHLQSSRRATLLVLGPFAAYTWYGYKRRSQRVKAFRKGAPIDLPPGVLAVMGLLPAEEEPVDVTPPEPTGALADALRKAGLV